MLDRNRERLAQFSSDLDDYYRDKGGNPKDNDAQFLDLQTRTRDALARSRRSVGELEQQSLETSTTFSPERLLQGLAGMNLTEVHFYEWEASTSGSAGSRRHEPHGGGLVLVGSKHFGFCRVWPA